MTTRVWNNHLAWLLGMVVLARLVLVSNTEMIGPPFDADGLAWLALNGFWERPSDSMRPPMLPLVAELVMHSGIPWRYFLEAIFVLVTVGLVTRLHRHLGSVAAVVCATAVLFNPYTLRSFTEFQREPLLLVLYLAWFWSILFVLDDRRRTLAKDLLSMVPFSLLGAAIILTREGEEVFVAGGAVLVLFVQLFLARARGASVRRAALRAIGVPAVVICLPLMLVAQINHDTWGLWSYRGILPSYQALLSQIHRIKVDDSVRYAPATRESFRVAMQLSPTFRSFGAPAIADDSVAHGGVNTWRAHSSEFVGRREIDPTRTIWLISLLINSVAPPNDPEQSAILLKAATELKTALDAGEWPSHSPSLPYPLDSNIGNWIAYVPSGLASNVMMLLAPTPDQAGRRDFTDHHAELFDVSLNRRTALVQGQYGGLRDSWREAIVHHYGALLAIMVLIVIVTSRRHRSTTDRPYAIGLLTLGVIFLARFSVYTVMHVSVAPVDRYQVVFAPITALILLLAAERIALIVKSRWSNRKHT